VAGNGGPVQKSDPHVFKVGGRRSVQAVLCANEVTMDSKSDVAQAKPLRRLQVFVPLGLGGLTLIILKLCLYPRLMLYEVKTATAGSELIGFQL
jgi:hypothetical protein